MSKINLFNQIVPYILPFILLEPNKNEFLKKIYYLIVMHLKKGPQYEKLNIILCEFGIIFVDLMEKVIFKLSNFMILKGTITYILKGERPVLQEAF